LEPAYRASITDLLSREDYTKASGLVQAAGSSKYLISPILAGYLLRAFDIKLLLVIDICTFFVTASAILFVRRSLASKRERGSASSNLEQVSAPLHGESVSASGSMRDDFREGWRAVAGNRGVLVLVIMGSVITFFLGFIQTLSTPMILAFADSSALGTTLTLSACGMLITSVLVGIIPMRHNFVNKLCASLFGAGIFMAFFGLRENIVFVCAAGFFFFSMLPVANTSLDYLIRTNISNELQGRAWGLIGVISQLGYVAAYAVSGILADHVFTPLLVKGGGLSGSVGVIIGTGTGRGTGFLILMAGLLLSLSAIILLRIKSIRVLETGGEPYVLQNDPK
jgi:MFS family permease